MKQLRGDIVWIYVIELNALYEVIFGSVSSACIARLYFHGQCRWRCGWYWDNTTHIWSDLLSTLFYIPCTIELVSRQVGIKWLECKQINQICGFLSLTTILTNFHPLIDDPSKNSHFYYEKCIYPTKKPFSQAKSRYFWREKKMSKRLETYSNCVIWW